MNYDLVVKNGTIIDGSGAGTGPMSVFWTGRLHRLAG